MRGIFPTKQRVEVRLSTSLHVVRARSKQSHSCRLRTRFRENYLHWHQSSQQIIWSRELANNGLYVMRTREDLLHMISAEAQQERSCSHSTIICYKKHDDLDQTIYLGEMLTECRFPAPPRNFLPLCLILSFLNSHLKSSR